jgi:hypothetical protein
VVAIAVAEGVELLDIAERQAGLLLHRLAKAAFQRPVLLGVERTERQRVAMGRRHAFKRGRTGWSCRRHLPDDQNARRFAGHGDTHRRQPDHRRTHAVRPSLLFIKVGVWQRWGEFTSAAEMNCGFTDCKPRRSYVDTKKEGASKWRNTGLPSFPVTVSARK